MPKVERTPPLTVAAFAMTGAAVGLLVQVFRSSSGHAPLVPPVSLSITLAAMAAVLLILGIALRRAVTRDTGGNVNPFTAVRILAGARAGQFAGALFGGFGAGLALSLLGRSVAAPTATWIPMVLVLGSGALLLGCGIVVERLCRIPPDDSEENGEPATG